MSTPTVTHTFTLPAGGLPSGITAYLKLIASTDGFDSFAYCGDDVAVVGKYEATMTYGASTATATWTSVRPNSGASTDAISVPANTRYEVTIKRQGRDVIAPFHIAVTDVTGPLVAGDLLTSAPTDLGAVVAAENTTVDDSDAPASVDTVQQYLDALSAIVSGQINYSTPLGQSRLSTLYTAINAGNARILVIGDSRTVLSGWPAAVDRLFHDRALANYYRSPGTTTPVSTANSWTGTGTETEATSVPTAGGSSGYYVTLTSGQSRTRTFSEPVGALHVTHKKVSGGGTFVIKQGASTVATINTANATTSWSNIAVGTGTVGTSAWTIECTSGTVVIEDATPCAGTTTTTGVKVYSCAHSGYDLDEWLTYSTVRTFWQNLAPTAVVIASGVNEPSAAHVTSYHTTLISALRTDLGASIPIVLMAPEVIGVAGSSATGRAKSDAVLTLSASLGTAYVNLQQIVGSINADGNAERMSTDFIHGEGGWSQVLADASAVVLSGDAVGVLVGALGRVRDLLRVVNVEVGNRAESNGRVVFGDPFGLGYTVGAVYDVGDEAGGASDNPQILIMPGVLAGLLGLPGASILMGPGGATGPTSGISYISSQLLGTNHDWRARSSAATGLTGAANQIRLAGRTTSGPPTTGTFAVGDFVMDATGRLMVCITAGTPGSWRDVGSTFGGAPTGTIRETTPRRAAALTNVAALTSGTVLVAGVPMYAGDVVSSVTFVSGGTAASSPTHWWFGLMDANRVVRAISANQTTTAWASNTATTLAMSAAYTIPTNGDYYLFVMVAAGTPPSLMVRANSSAVVHAIAPVLCGTSSTGQTTPPAVGATLGALSATANHAYGYAT